MEHTLKSRAQRRKKKKTVIHEGATDVSDSLIFQRRDERREIGFT